MTAASRGRRFAFAGGAVTLGEHDGSVLAVDHPCDGRPMLLGAGDLELAAQVMRRFYPLDGQHFPAFELGSVITDLARQLTAAGRTAEAEHLTGRLVQQATTFLA
ncbi:MAG TPA: hypothetical protein VK401_03420 [Propionibacteriaceae bacterium]|nr:hypothetical protein [Propionibacteriaceae bacterium]